MKLPSKVVRDPGAAPFTSFFAPVWESESASLDPEISTLRSAMNSMIDASLRPFSARGLGVSTPAIDLYEKDGVYHVECAIPGLKKEDFDVEVSENRLAISAKYQDDHSDKGARYHYREMRRGAFSRSISFPQEIDAERVSASYEHGVLHLTVPTAKPINAKKVAIKG